MRTATEYFYYIDNNEIKMPRKAFIKYAEEQGMSKDAKKRFLNRMTRGRKGYLKGAGKDYEEKDKKYEKMYDEWLKGGDPLYEKDLRKGTKEYADKRKKERDERVRIKMQEK